MKIVDLFRDGKITSSNKHLQRAVNSLQWRQQYQFSDVYKLELDSGIMLELHQVRNGESKGIGTGALVG